MKNKLALILFCTLAFFSCRNRQQEEVMPSELKIDSISILYYNYMINTARAIKCGELQAYSVETSLEGYIGVFPETITDSIILNKIQTQLELLTPTKENSYPDTRIQLKVHYNNKHFETICISGVFPSELYREGIRQNPNNELLYLIKNSIGYYSWFEGIALESMVEIQDTSFAKEPFKVSKYHKEQTNEK